MPELPEVETVCRGLSKKLLNLKVLKVTTFDKKLRYSISKNIEKYLIHNKVKAIIRRGKNGLIVFSGNYNLHFHLGMTGKFSITNSDYVKKKHDHFLIKFDKNVLLIYNDVRKFGYVELIKKPLDIVSFKNIGVEPFLCRFFEKELYSKICKKERSIKEILLDQNYICGIGNIYASEILFRSKISPFKLGKDLRGKEFQAILSSVEYILNKAIKKGGSSIKNYKNIDEELGYFQIEFKVYDKEGMACYQCNNLIAKRKQSGRSTFFCKSCQPIN